MQVATTPVEWLAQAQQPDSWLQIVVAVVIVIVLGVLALLLFRGYEGLARNALVRCYRGLSLHDIPGTGDVVLTYHTYHGLVAWFTQTTHQVVLPAEEARLLLGRLLRFNLTWGLLTWGAAFVIPLSLGNYFAQRRSISVQKSAGAAPGENDHNPA